MTGTALPEREIRDQVADSVRTVARRISATAVAADWLQALGSAGLLGVGASADYGGGGSLMLAGVVARESALVDAPIEVLHHLIASAILSELEADAEALADIADGTREVAVAFCWSPGDSAATPSSAARPRWLIVEGSDGSCAWQTAAVSSGAWLHPQWRDVTVCRPSKSDSRGLGVAPRSPQIARALTAAFCVGLADALLIRAVDHAKSRHQFGQPIGAFQAVKHSLANAKIDLLHTRALVDAGLEALDTGAADARWVVAAAKDMTGRATQLAAERCVQTFGGLGFSAEHDAHRFLKTIVRLRHFPESAIRLRSELLDPRSEAELIEVTT